MKLSDQEKLARGGKRVEVLLYADDIIIYCPVSFRWHHFPHTRIIKVHCTYPVHYEGRNSAALQKMAAKIIKLLH